MTEPTSISDENKNITYVFWEKSRVADPAYACQDIGALVAHLVTLAESSGIHDYDTILNFASIKASESWFEYSEKRNPGRAIVIKNNVLARIDRIIKDPRFCKIKINQFVGGAGVVR
jgi:hypothetical protein